MGINKEMISLAVGGQWSWRGEEKMEHTLKINKDAGKYS